MKTYHAYICSKSNVHIPAFAGEFLARNLGEAYRSASKEPCIRKLINDQQTMDLTLQVHLASMVEPRKA